MYYRIKPSIYSDHGIREEPRLRRDISFKKGCVIEIDISTPMVFYSDNTEENPPRHFEGISIPVMSKILTNHLLSLGVDNIVLYDAIIKNQESGKQWIDYYAINIIGLISCVDLDTSIYVEIGQRPAGPALAKYQHLVIDPQRTLGAKLFRLAESPSVILIIDKIWEELKLRMSENNWGFSVFPVDTIDNQDS
jgi:hypothetical protein